VAGNAGNLPPLIIKRVKKGGHGAAHGSSTWKIALADFMTAMFIIFLLLWLISQTTPEQRAGIADYFAPASASRSTNGSGGVMGGRVIAQPGAMPVRASQLGPPGGGPSVPQEGEGNTDVKGYPGTAPKPLGDKVAPGISKSSANSDDEGKRFAQVSQQIRQAIQEVPELQGSQQNLLIDQTRKGLRIQLIDNDKAAMFGNASAAPLPNTVKLMAQVAKVIASVPNKIEISGHTDSSQFSAKAAYTNWELSSDRANASRRLLVADGIADNRIVNVVGKADREPLFPDEPASPRNRRISIVLLNEASANAAANGSDGDSDSDADSAPTKAAEIPSAPDGPLIKR
jgi:chemotaxis protein MotB